MAVSGHSDGFAVGKKCEIVDKIRFSSGYLPTRGRLTHHNKSSIFSNLVSLESNETAIR